MRLYSVIDSRTLFKGPDLIVLFTFTTLLDAVKFKYYLSNIVHSPNLEIVSFNGTKDKVDYGGGSIFDGKDFDTYWYKGTIPWEDIELIEEVD